MTICRNLRRIGLALLLTAPAAGDRPTAPERFSTADRLEADLLRDSSGAASSIWFRMGADDLAGRMPAAGPVELVLDGRRYVAAHRDEFPD